jgi:hypothetical protein
MNTGLAEVFMGGRIKSDHDGERGVSRRLSLDQQ